MNPERHFLDWNAPIVERVRDWLLPKKLSEAADLSNTLVITPTKQAGRRLREALALHCADQGTALIPPVVKEPLFFTDQQSAVRIAGPLLARGVWVRVLLDIDPSDYPGLFPVLPARRDLAWATHTADQIQRVRNTLVEGGFLIRDVSEQQGALLQEPERWADLAQLETRYLQRLLEAGWQDRAAALIRQSAAPALPPGVQRVVVAAVPDPSLLMIRALTRLMPACPVDVLIHAPAERADAFDEWGRPQRQTWNTALIDIPDADTNIRLAATPIEQAQIALDVITEEASRLGPSDLAIGVPDPEVIPYVDAHLAERGLVTFDPAGTPLTQHRLFHALEAVHALLDDPSYRNVGHLWRHPDVLAAAQRTYGVDPAALLTQLDRLQNKHLPQTAADMAYWLKTHYADSTLTQAWPLIVALQDCAKLERLVDMVSAIMSLIYSGQPVNPQTPEGDAFRQVAGRINRLIAETHEPAFAVQRLSHTDTLALVIAALRSETYYEERKDAQVDLEGWLELPWNNARLLIVTGMNDGMVPDGRISDLFLPDSLLSALGLRADADRLARDAYLMTTLIESRRKQGRVAFVAGSRSRGGDPLRPSRLFFRCADHELADRAGRLFREPAAGGVTHAASVSFLLKPSQCRAYTVPEHVGVTALNSYLACPFRFYLRVILRMQPVSDNKVEMDAMDFGSLAHHALRGLSEMPTCDDPSTLAALFLARAETGLKAQFGARPPLPVCIQFESLKQRLIAAAHAHVEHIREGWIPTHFELPVRRAFGAIELRGTIDRADYHPDLKQWRIIDYKTRDQAGSMDKTHFAPVREDTPDYARTADAKGKERRWIDLQLPLYATLFKGVEPDAAASVGIFHLPKAVTSTRLDMWSDLTEQQIASAWTCAEGILADIEAGHFWPPADKTTYDDDYETLFPAPPAECVAGWPIDSLEPRSKSIYGSAGRLALPQNTMDGRANRHGEPGLKIESTKGREEQ